MNKHNPKTLLQREHLNIYDEYLTVKSQEKHHEEKQKGPQRCNRHLSNSSRISNERQTRP